MFNMSNEIYDKMKFFCLIVMPAAATLYAGLGKIWGLPYVSEIPATITAFATFLGICLKVSSDNYHKDGDADV